MPVGHSSSSAACWRHHHQPCRDSFVLHLSQRSCGPHGCVWVRSFWRGDDTGIDDDDDDDYDGTQQHRRRRRQNTPYFIYRP